MTGFPVPRPWAKLSRGTDGEIEAHLSLLDHSADVAATAEALLDLRILRRRLARLAALDDLGAVQTARLCVLTALHDLGKVNHGFQRKALNVAGEGHIGCFWRALTSISGSPAPRLIEALVALCPWFSHDDAMFTALRAVLSHHGEPPQDGATTRLDDRLWRAADGYDPEAAGIELIGATRRWFPEAWEVDGAEILPSAPAFWHAFAGIVTLADRLGSDESRFTYPHGPEPGETRFDFARRTAKSVLKARFIRPDPPRAAASAIPWRFEELFPGFAAPQPAQAAVLGAEVPGGGSVAILEAETGSGKTEAALLHFLHLFRAGIVDGMYFALPTRASAVQIQRRIDRELKRLLGPAAPDVVLAVPGYLRAGDRNGQPLPRFQVQWPDDEDGQMRDRGWAAEHPTRYLAGFVVVGTVDQTLLAALDVKDARFRAAALLRHLLVVDEVHASDAYMITLLTGYLRLHVEAGGHALLMSATLGAEARARLLATSTGLRQREVPLPDPAAACALPYPLLSGLGGTRMEPGKDRPEKRIGITLLDQVDDLDAVARIALDAAAAGARVLMIFNTVRRALAAQVALEAVATGRESLLFGVDGVSCPHHARFAAEDRMRLDEEVERRFGKESTDPVVLAATQTVEQSLDIDADLLITDLCPADVLLQRFGRLHRHPGRCRPFGFELPRGVVLAPTVPHLGEHLRTPGRFGLGFGRVYPNIVGLAATRMALEAKPLVVVPTDNRALVEAGTHSALLESLADKLGGGWSKVLHDFLGASGAVRSLADNHRIKWTSDLAPARKATDELMKARTRLGAIDALVRLAEGVQGPFGTPVGRIKVPGWMLPEEWEGDVPESVAEIRSGTLTFRFAEIGFIYDRLGLRIDE